MCEAIYRNSKRKSETPSPIQKGSFNYDVTAHKLVSIPVTVREYIDWAMPGVSDKHTESSEQKQVLNVALVN